MAEPIHDIIECSLKTEKVPQEWKRANIMPIYKNGNKEEPLDYRPVSLTSIVCKICEKVIKKQWTEYLDKTRNNKVDTLDSEQDGHMSQTYQVSFKGNRYNTRKRWVGEVHIFRLEKKAFDKVPHRRLLWRLEHIGGFKGTIMNWMEDYLKGREMITGVKDEKSE